MTKAIKNLILDMDGVLWQGETPFSDINYFFDAITEMGLGVVMATNNASRTQAQYIEKLAKFNIHCIPEDMILTSAEVTAAFISPQLDKGASVYIVGGDGVRHAFKQRGHRLLTTEQVFRGTQAQAVIVGFYRHVTYDDLAMGCHLIHQGARFIGTNPDVSFPYEYGLLPGAGASLAFVQAATGVEPTIIGKPGKIIFEEALRRLNGTTADTVMVGDRLDTDVAGGVATGLTTFMVTTGISKREEVATSSVKPSRIFDSLTEIVEYLQNG